MKIVGNDFYFDNLEAITNNFRRIGEGSDAIIYDSKNGFVFKLYKFSKFDLQAETKIYAIGLTKAPDPLNQKQYSASVINKAVARQANVALTRLPQGRIFILDPITKEYHFGGCVYEKYNFIYDIFNFCDLPKTFLNKRMMIPVLYKVKELCENYIYVQSDLYSKKSSNTNHSNVKINWQLKPVLIDLDGKSALYTDERDIAAEFGSYYAYFELLLDVLFDIDTYENTFDNEGLAQQMVGCGISQEFIELLAYDDPYYELLLEFISYTNQGFKNKTLSRSLGC